MRLISLTANKESFRAVEFNRSGLTLIVGKKSDPDDRSREHSTNGVGKSLLLYLINFCLGAAENPQLTEHLPGWEFTLSYEQGSDTYAATRATNVQSKVVVNGQTKGLDEFKLSLGEDVFGIGEEPIKFLTFRTLVSLFLRQGKPAYASYESTAKNERQYSKQLRSAYLLGLNETLVDRKRDLKDEKDRIKSIRSQFKKDSLLRDYFHGERDAGLELRDLEEDIKKLEIEASDFRVADNYEEVTAKHDAVRREWKQASNELDSLQSSRRQIEQSLKEQPDVSLEEVARVYEATEVSLPESVVKQLHDVEVFHEELTAMRAVRLTKEKHSVERRISDIEALIESLNQKKDEYFKFLGSHGALQEYETLLNTLADRRQVAARLTEFQRLKKSCDERWQRNKLEMSEEAIRTSEYLEAADAITNALSDRFRSMARRIWPQKTSGLVIENNDGDNQIRFDIDARIEGDASDGTAESKIFCFDMTVLIEGRNHSMKFLMHDNRLYPGIDPRQRAELFRVASELSEKYDCQYIASLNEDNLAAMKTIMDDKEYESLLISKVELELMDDSAAGKLLGITVDLKYN
ncbi:DUF2326 domain-containing protein [Allorhodopirellula solitaria]|uniref:DUF2326 domain-containing protein n=1 Tax=Allorhodopirellula solitaria TaxID=2527987 RepID=A0A5C5XVF0_9BACT|nr:DUF2326 domain-containing protein [Allorhodopirellula solitaria]TWT66658.1 hypothetical protein CA85_27550 [Allorhodopirellula solitaria]